MTSTGPVLLMAFGGFLLGGAYSLRSQGKPRIVVVLMAALGVIAVIGGLLWL